MRSPMQHRDLIIMVFLLICTLGFYFLYWSVVTKRELCERGADIPTAWLLIIPFANFYFWYKYAQGFAKHVLYADENSAIGYFLLMVLLPPVGMLIYQSEFNKL